MDILADDACLTTAEHGQLAHQERESKANSAATLPVVAGDELRRAHLFVRVGGEDVAITWATRNEIVKLLQRAPGSLRVVLYFENVGSRRPIDLDEDGKQHLLQALTHWHDHPAIGKAFPADAQTLLTALAGELEAR